MCAHVQKNADGERFRNMRPTESVEFEGFAGALVTFNYCEQ